MHKSEQGRVRTYHRETLEELVEQAYPEGTGKEITPARDQVNAVLGAIKAWIVASVITVQLGEEKRLVVRGFGSFHISLARRGHHRNKRKLEQGLVKERPQTIQIHYRPTTAVIELIERRNAAEYHAEADHVSKGAYRRDRTADHSYARVTSLIARSGLEAEEVERVLRPRKP